MSPAELKLVKYSEEIQDEVESEEEEIRTFSDRLPGLAVAGGYIAAGLVLFLVGNITVGLLLALHGLGLASWLLLVLYCLLGGALVRLSRERERVVKAVTLQRAAYLAWTADELPQRWERWTARVSTGRPKKRQQQR